MVRIRVWVSVRARVRVRVRVGHCSLQPLRRVPRLAYPFKGHLDRDDPVRRGGGVRHAEATAGDEGGGGLGSSGEGGGADGGGDSGGGRGGSPEVAAGGGGGVGGVGDGHCDLPKLHAAPEEEAHSRLEGRRVRGVDLTHLVRGYGYS